VQHIYAFLVIMGLFIACIYHFVSMKGKIMSPEKVTFLAILVAALLPFALFKRQKEKKTLRSQLFIDYSDCVFTRTLFQSESRLNGEDYAAKLYPPERLIQIVYAETIDSLGFADDMRNELKGVPLKKLGYLRALQMVCLGEDGDDVQDAFKLYPKHRAVFEAIRENRRQFLQNLNLNKARIDEQQYKQDQAVEQRIDLSQTLRDKTDLLNWLVKHGPDPDFWHVFVCNTDPNQRAEVYHWIITQPQCDAGTAAQIFHHSNAYEALEHRSSEFPPHLMRLYSTAKIAADRWAAGNFQTHRFAPNDIYSSTSYEEFKRIENEAIQKFGAAAFKLSDGLFDDKPREKPKTNLFFTDF